MANIDKELKAIMDAVYGEEVRGSIHDALKAGNDEINRYGLQESARVAAEQARAQAESARATAENAREAAELLRQQGESARQQATQAAVTAAENAATAANTAADRANAVADEDISDKQVQFTEAAEKSEIESGDTLGTICGKVKKSLAEMDGEIAKVIDNVQNKISFRDISENIDELTNQAIGMGISNGGLYITIGFDYICLQFRCTYEIGLSYRIYYGNSHWGEWKAL
ncbi:MAG: hypothetical protein HFI68_01075 [Lachnospiraceae bacterium]|nr:hypothetical protein [Lachnospiraceae bacterium]